MKCLFVLEGGAGAILPLVPLAQALRGAGHEVIAATHAESMQSMLGAGIPTVAAPLKSPKDYRAIRDGQLVPLTGDVDERAIPLGTIGANIAVDAHRELLEMARLWRPDLIVGGPLAYAAPLLSADLDVPYVAVEFGFAEPLNWHLATLEELARQGFGELPEPAQRLILCPESFRHPDGAMRYLPGQAMRYLPFSPARTVEPWMYAKGRRPRVWVSAGSRVGSDYGLDYLRRLVDSAARLDVELLVATPDELADRLGPLPDNTKVGWLPFDVLAPTCDLAVHHGGGSTLLGLAAHGVPQVMIPNVPEFREYLATIENSGAVKVLSAKEDTPADVLLACEELLSEASYRKSADRLRAEMLTAPTPQAMVHGLESIAARIDVTLGGN
ncbi:nucleotide disphospho-sugar-binding domain-containing protein [Streptomyces sp. NPDC054871]